MQLIYTRVAMVQVKLYTVGKCKECDHVKMMLKELGIEYVELDVTTDPWRQEVVKVTGCYSVPQLVLGTIHVGDYDTIVDLYKSKKLAEELGAT